MIYLLGGYMWLYVHRPFEVKGFQWLGALQLERGYMFLMLTAWLVYPGKGLSLSRMHLAIGSFMLAVLGGWATSPYANSPGCWEAVDNALKVFVFYGLMVTCARDEKALRQLIGLFLVATGLYMAHSFYEFLCGRYQWRMGVSRMMGVDITYGDPNAFAATLLYTLPLLVPFWAASRTWDASSRFFTRWLVVGYALLACFCIMRTGSRGGFVGLCLWGVMAVVASSQKKFQALVLCGVLGVVGLVAMTVVMPDDVQNRFLTLIDSEAGPANAQLSADGRMAGFLEGIRVWSQSPLFGHGPAAFVYATGREGQAHNLYGQVLSELGIVGALALAMMVAFFLSNWRLAHRLRSGPDDFAYQVARAVGFIVILLLVMGWGGHNLFRYNWQWFAAFQCVAMHVLWSRAEQRAYEPQAYPAYAGAWA